MNNYKIYTGPTRVQTAARLLRDAGVEVYLEGTEHVYAVAQNSDIVLQPLRASGWTWRDVRESASF